MAVTVTHATVTAVPDDPAYDIGSDEWNANHTVTNALDKTGDTMTGALAITLGTITTSNPAWNITQTWNAGAVTFTGLKLNVTNTASNAASVLMDLQVGGTPQVQATVDGRMYARLICGVYDGGYKALLYQDDLYLGSGGKLRFTDNTSSLAGTPDAGLQRSASKVLWVTDAQSNGASLQFTEMTAPAAGAANTARIFCEDNGAGKTRLMVQFNTGAAQQIAIEP